jgi:hypothetical protein
MRERPVLCVHCQIAVVATLTGEWTGTDLEIVGPVLCNACVSCLRDKGVRCVTVLEAALGGGEDPPPLFVCKICGARSWNPNDARERYCGRCHRFVDDPAPGDA